MIRIDDLRDDEQIVLALAATLVESFAESNPDAWPTMESAIQEVRASLEAGRLSRVAFDDGEPIGWAGGIPLYDGNVFELHPLLVRADKRRKGVGRMLVDDIARIAAERGASTLTLGSDDETGATTLGGIDLYPDVVGHLARIRNVRGHPIDFYLRVGFSVTGVLPDANGPGKPDIFFSKPLR